MSTGTRRIVISGCSSGGKSTLLAALAERGHRVFAEPGRAVVKAETATGGTGLPWVDPKRFADLVITRGIADWQAAEGLCFYDRSLIDAVTWCEGQTEQVPDQVRNLIQSHRYDSPVFLAPPLPEIYVQDDERWHGLDAAIAEYNALRQSYPAKGYDIRILPKTDVAARADWVLAALDG
ncbi:AAA family ATPase [Cognatiyoonia sp. IB215446]|uniref:AAA family ATPase n=1 Tax=Cognatiyoonia sp. IB215446 TaxID=3097355 RepID=UPI002A0DF6EA|nr:AAA family ATPase [Cognatiyoonia sp. IB215446]MDX8348351.1 AAA family ATPase [Cognatiyoonia sp. IB215446]